MEVNWFTVIAQIVNFLILVWLLKRFLYKPVLDAIDQREEKIAKQLSDAEEKKAEAEKERTLYVQKNITFDNERTAKLEEVREEVSSEKKRLLEEARKESSVLRSKYEETLKQQKQDLKDSVKRKTKEAVFSIASKTLTDLANANLEEQAVDVFIAKIKSLDADSKTKLKNALENADMKVTIKSVFEIPLPIKHELEKRIKEITEQENDFLYQMDPNLISGIEIGTKAYQVSWNIESYLDALKENTTTKNETNATR